MTERTLPTVFINDVLGAHADDPGILRIGVRLAGDVEAQLMLPVTKIDPFIGVLVTGKGFFDWPPPPNRDRHHGITEIEVAAGEGKVALRIVGRVADKSPGPPPPPGHLDWLRLAPLQRLPYLHCAHAPKYSGTHTGAVIILRAVSIGPSLSSAIMICLVVAVEPGTASESPVLGSLLLTRSSSGRRCRRRPKPFRSRHRLLGGGRGREPSIAILLIKG